MNNLSYNDKVKFGVIGIVVVFVLLIITISAYGVFFANINVLKKNYIA